MSKWSLLLLALTACLKPHAALLAPPPGASAEERVKAYESHRPRGESKSSVVQEGDAVAERTDYLILGDGTRIYHPEDLTPLVAAESRTAQSAARSKDATEQLTLIAYIGAAVTIAGVAVMAVGGTDSDLFYPGLGASLLGVGGVVGAGIYYWPTINDERTSAFSTYEDDLRKQLDICVNGLEVVACPATAPTP
jgi:hypothetical protein